MPHTINMSVNVAVNNGQKIIDVTTDVRKLGEEFKRGQTRVESFAEYMVKINQVGQAFQSLGNSIRQVTGVLNELTAAQQALGVVGDEVQLAQSEGCASADGDGINVGPRLGVAACRGPREG